MPCAIARLGPGSYANFPLLNFQSPDSSQQSKDQEFNMLWVKALHIVAVVTWFSGLFYLPRLFVNHRMDCNEVLHERFVIMERKLFWAITTPSAVVTVGLGSWLLISNWGYFMAWWWMHAKLTLVALLLIYHYFCWHYMIQLRNGTCTRSHKFFRLFNELPTPILVAVVILIVVKLTLT